MAHKQDLSYANAAIGKMRKSLADTLFKLFINENGEKIQFYVLTNKMQ